MSKGKPVILMVTFGMTANLLSCYPNFNSGCAVAQTINLSNYDEVARLGTQFSQPAYLDQIISYSHHAFPGLGTIVKVNI